MEENNISINQMKRIIDIILCKLILYYIEKS